MQEMCVPNTAVYPDKVLNAVMHSIQVNVKYFIINQDLFLPVRLQFTNHNPSAILHYIVTCTGRPRRMCVDNIKMYLREIGWDDIDWIDLAQDRDQWRALVNTVMNLRVP
jgi:hypothetical protein